MSVQRIFYCLAQLQILTVICLVKGLWNRSVVKCLEVLRFGHSTHQGKAVFLKVLLTNLSNTTRMSFFPLLFFLLAAGCPPSLKRSFRKDWKERKEKAFYFSVVLSHCKSSRLWTWMFVEVVAIKLSWYAQLCLV